MHENTITFKDAQKASDAIVRTLKPVSVILFGSVAREGTGRDVDLLVITDDEKGNGKDKNILLHKCLKRFYWKALSYYDSSNRSKKTACPIFILPFGKK